MGKLIVSAVVVLFVVVIIAAASSVADAATPTPSPAPAPAPDYVNITQILVNGGDYSTLVKWLKDTGVGEKFQIAANNSEVGITIFAPIDNAFKKEPAKSLLGNLTSEQKITLLEYHALNQWDSLKALQNTDMNETGTFATYNGGATVYHYNGQQLQLNITFVGGVVEIVTPWNRVQVTNTLHQAFPVSIFALDQILLPVDLFAFPAPSPAPSPDSGTNSPSPAGSGTSATSTAAGPGGANTNNAVASRSVFPAAAAASFFLAAASVFLF